MISMLYEKYGGALACELCREPAIFRRAERRQSTLHANRATQQTSNIDNNNRNIAHRQRDDVKPVNRCRAASHDNKTPARLASQKSQKR
jgi:hypothetical protein